MGTSSRRTQPANTGASEPGMVEARLVCTTAKITPEPPEEPVVDEPTAAVEPAAARHEWVVGASSHRPRRVVPREAARSRLVPSSYRSAHPGRLDEGAPVA